MARQPGRLWRRVLALCPTLIAVLWVAGIARFRDYEFTPIDWSVIVLMAFALQVIAQRSRRPRPLPKLPANTNPALLAALAATMFTVIATIVSGLVEWFIDSVEPAHTSLWLRTTWHAACCFGACYCAFLLRIQIALSQQQSPGPPPPRRGS